VAMSAKVDIYFHCVCLTFSDGGQSLYVKFSSS